MTLGVDSINTRILLEEISQVKLPASLTSHLTPSQSAEQPARDRQSPSLQPDYYGVRVVAVVSDKNVHHSVWLLPGPPGAGLLRNPEEPRELELFMAAARRGQDGRDTAGL